MVVQVHKSPAAVVLYLACLRVASIYVPLNDAYTDGEVAALLEDAEARVLVCDPARQAGLAAVAQGTGVVHVLGLDSEGRGSLWDAADAADPVVHASEASDPAVLLYTSGTTGRPKGAVLSHQNLASNALALHALWGF